MLAGLARNGVTLQTAFSFQTWWRIKHVELYGYHQCRTAVDFGERLLCVILISSPLFWGGGGKDGICSVEPIYLAGQADCYSEPASSRSPFLRPFLGRLAGNWGSSCKPSGWGNSYWEGEQMVLLCERDVRLESAKKQPEDPYSWPIDITRFGHLRLCRLSLWFLQSVPQSVSGVEGATRRNICFGGSHVLTLYWLEREGFRF